MQYFDANVLVHFFADFDLKKHQESRNLIEEVIGKNIFHVSLLCVQETSFAMAKLQQSLNEINRAVKNLIVTNPVGYAVADFKRASELAQFIGFKHINDCLHTAMAESHGCTELITYNRKDFVRIQPLTSLNIIIL